MNKKANTTNGIRDCISKLFILKDSCTGTCITQKNNPNIIWFEGAAVLLRQSVEKLKSAQQKSETSGKGPGKEFGTDVKEIISKLIVLKSSCRGGSSSEESAENIAWFEGAESIISEVLEQLQKAAPESEAVMPAAAESEGGADAEEAEKQAAAG